MVSTSWLSSSLKNHILIVFLILCSASRRRGFSSAYDIGCIYPSTMTQDLMQTRHDIASFVIGQIYPTLAGTAGSPIVAHHAMYITGCSVQCLAYHDPDVLDPFTKEETFITVPPFGHNGYSVTMCQMQCLYSVLYELGMEDMIKTGLLNAIFGLEVIEVNSRPDIESAWETFVNDGNESILIDILEGDDYHPLTMGYLAGIYLSSIMADDGFNHDGRMIWSPSLGEAVPCTTPNCRRYQDTTGYKPVIDPRLYPEYSTDSDKYNCTGPCRHWQPLQVGSMYYSTRQEFFAPHIGVNGKTYLRNATLTLDDPEYDLYQESLDVVDQVFQTYQDATRKNYVTYFHDSFVGVHSTRGALHHRISAQFDGIHSYQDHLMFYHGLSLGEWDGFIQVWREKVHHDLVRPTTVIKHWDDDKLGSTGVRAREFEAYFDVSASAEFPSSTSCFCTTFFEFTDAFTNDMYNETLFNIIGGGIVFNNMERFRNTCGQSHYVGGFVFSASVGAGEEICSGLGQLANEYIKTVRNNTSYSGNAWYPGDTLPECPSGQ